MDERLRTQVLSVTVSQCQASMRDVNPTSKQGPEEEPLDNRTLNPRHQANTALDHTHIHTHTCARTSTQHTQVHTQPTGWTRL